MCVSGKSGIIVGNKLIENWSPSLSAELVLLGFNEAATEGRRFNPSSSLPFFSLLTIARNVPGSLCTNFAYRSSSLIRQYIV